MTSTGSRRRRVSFPRGIFLAALLLRLVPVLLTRNLGIGLDDMFQYDMLARSLAAGNGYRWYTSADLERLKPYVNFDLSSVDYDPVRGVEASFRPPLYPAFLALIYLLVGNGPQRFFAVRLVQVFHGAALVPLTYLISRKLFPGRERVARISAWVVTLYPMLVAFPLALATENLFFPLVLASLLALLNTREKPSLGRFILTGILFGLSALTRSVVLIFCGLAIVWLWFSLEKHWRRGVIYTFLALSSTILPWMVRNSLLNHRLSGIETSLGYQLYVGYHPQSTGTFQFGISLDLIPILNDGIRDRIGMEKALEFIRESPSRFVPLAVNRLGYFFELERRALQYFYSNNFFGFIPFPWLVLISVIFLVPFAVISTSGVLGFAVSRWNPQLTLLALLVIGYLLPHVLIISEDRFHMTLIPVFAILSARFWTGGFPSLDARWQESKIGKLVVMLAVCAVILLLLNWGLELSRDADKIIQLFGPNGNRLYFDY